MYDTRLIVNIHIDIYKASFYVEEFTVRGSGF